MLQNATAWISASSHDPGQRSGYCPAQTCSAIAGNGAHQRGLQRVRTTAPCASVIHAAEYGQRTLYHVGRGSCSVLSHQNSTSSAAELASINDKAPRVRKAATVAQVIEAGQNVD